MIDMEDSKKLIKSEQRGLIAWSANIWRSTVAAWRSILLS